MTRMVRALLAGFVAPLGLVILGSEPANAAQCSTSGNLLNAHTYCAYSPGETKDFYASGDGHHYEIALVCGLGGDVACTQERECVGPPPGFWYQVFRDGEPIGTTCLSEHDAESLGEVTPGLVLKAFQRLTWPQSELVVQPPDGVTLVGFATNFYTTNTAPTIQTVTLLSRRIQIEATPASYVWQFGDDTSQTTRTPGAAYPDLLVTHPYQHPGQVRPRVDTVYAGRYRVGSGPWQSIPGTLTVAGSTADLEVQEAQGVLVGE